MAANDGMQLSLEIPLGWSLEIALFVAPVLVYAGLLMGNAMDLVLNPFELIALGAAAFVAALVALDGGRTAPRGLRHLGDGLLPPPGMTSADLVEQTGRLAGAGKACYNPVVNLLPALDRQVAFQARKLGQDPAEALSSCVDWEFAGLWGFISTLPRL